MIETLHPVRWLLQPITLPLAGYLLSLLLPAAYFAKRGKDLIEQRLSKSE